jgi:hypothetical protein
VPEPATVVTFHFFGTEGFSGLTVAFWQPLVKQRITNAVSAKVFCIIQYISANPIAYASGLVAQKWVTIYFLKETTIAERLLSGCLTMIEYLW